MDSIWDPWIQWLFSGMESTDSMNPWINSIALRTGIRGSHNSKDSAIESADSIESMDSMYGNRSKKLASHIFFTPINFLRNLYVRYTVCDNVVGSC